MLIPLVLQRDEIKKQSDFIKDLDKWNFKTSELNKTIKGVDNLVKYHFDIEKRGLI